MLFGEGETAKTPLDITIPYAHELARSKVFEDFCHSELETLAVRDVNVMLESMDMIKDYNVTTGLAFVLPEDIESSDDEGVRLTRLDLDTEFEGHLMGGRTLKIGRRMGEQSVRAVCLAFNEALIISRKVSQDALVPVFTELEDEETLYVPVLAVSDITARS